jgi:hypothetical protein
MVANNASFNCNSAKLLIVQKSWDKRGTLVEKIEAGLKKAPVRHAYYPGAADRWKQFTDGRSAVKLVGNAGEGQLPYAIIPDVDPNKTDDRVFSQEPWCTVLSEMGLEGATPAEYFKAAVKFVNEADAVLSPSTSAVSSWSITPLAEFVELHVGPAAQPFCPLMPGPASQQPDGNVPGVVVPPIVERNRPSANTMSP